MPPSGSKALPSLSYTSFSIEKSSLEVCRELFMEVENQAENHDFILRGYQNRSLVPNEGSAHSIDEALSRCEILSECEVNISERTSMIAGETRPRRKSRASDRKSVV